MVESGSQVMEAITDDQRQHWIKRLRFWEPESGSLPIIVNFTGGEDILSILFRSKTGLDSRVDIKEVMLCSGEL
jgi:hypothetical protein